MGEKTQNKSTKGRGKDFTRSHFERGMSTKDLGIFSYFGTAPTRTVENEVPDLRLISMKQCKLYSIWSVLAFFANSSIVFTNVFSSLIWIFQTFYVGDFYLATRFHPSNPTPGTGMSLRPPKETSFADQ